MLSYQPSLLQLPPPLQQSYPLRQQPPAPLQQLLRLLQLPLQKPWRQLLPAHALGWLQGQQELQAHLVAVVLCHWLWDGHCHWQQQQQVLLQGVLLQLGLQAAVVLLLPEELALEAAPA
jgi:hypothetical protein